MRKLLLAAAGAMALVGGATTANAASTIIGVTPATLTPPASAIFGAIVNGTAGTTTAINDTFTFSIAGGPAMVDAQVSTILLGATQNITFSAITLDGHAMTKTSNDPAPETWALLSPATLANGSYTINVIGTLTGAVGAYSGTLNAQAAAVPEAKTWMMMLLGFGAMGFAVRRRRQTGLAQIA